MTVHNQKRSGSVARAYHFQKVEQLQETIAAKDARIAELEAAMERLRSGITGTAMFLESEGMEHLAGLLLLFRDKQVQRITYSRDDGSLHSSPAVADLDEWPSALRGEGA